MSRPGKLNAEPASAGWHDAEPTRTVHATALNDDNVNCPLQRILDTTWDEKDPVHRKFTQP
jgi:hypothetical protein